MKTITEFQSIQLKNAAQLKKDLATSGKTPEELPQALGETLKLEGDRLTFLLAAVETVDNKFQDLKRVLVMTLAEGEKAPHKALQKGDHWFVAEYYPPLAPKGGPRKGGGRFDGKGGGKGGKKKGGRGGRGDRERGGGGPGRGPGEGRGEGRPPGGGGRGPRRDRDQAQMVGGGKGQKPIKVVVVGGGGGGAPIQPKAPVVIKPKTPIEPKGPASTPEPGSSS